MSRQIESWHWKLRTADVLRSESPPESKLEAERQSATPLSYPPGGRTAFVAQFRNGPKLPGQIVASSLPEPTLARATWTQCWKISVGRASFEQSSICFLYTNK